MNSPRFMPALGALCLVVFCAFYLWQTPGLAGGRLRPEEIDRYLAAADRQLAMPAQEKAGALQRLRTWAAADDGKPFYMLNLMRYYQELRRFPGAPDYAGTPRQSNAYYESAAERLLLKSGSYPLMGGTAAGRDILDTPPELDNWDRVLVVRYRSRRAFLELLSDPAYGPIEPYKLMALQVLLVPVSAELVIPELRWLAGGALLVLFLATGWLRAARRRAT
ncbi:MAG: hypothetical protein P4L83_07000 [Nevskia sp.]|nr:hypothetical protein [Nevskia sp.]